LKALAHPLRVELYETLSALGASTASALAERLGESSGSTSYHLRQLARHGLVREVEGKGSGRERWWEVRPGGFTVSAQDYEQESGRVAAQMVVRQWERRRTALLEDLQARADELEPEWQEATTLSTVNVTATAEEMIELRIAFEEFSAKYVDPLRNREMNADSRRAQIHFNAFPILDAPRRTSEGA
jgi:DNA-binding transcriptional ArsR family regulator